MRWAPQSTPQGHPTKDTGPHSFPVFLKLKGCRMEPRQQTRARQLSGFNAHVLELKADQDEITRKSP